MEKGNLKKEISTELSKEDVHLLAASIARIADNYVATTREKPKIPWYKFWKHPHFLPISLIVLAFFGYWLNWRGDIINTQIDRLQDKIAQKQNKEEKLNEALVRARYVVVNQTVECNDPQRSLAQEQIERNNALVNLDAQATGTRFIYNQAIQDKVNEIAADIFNITDVCKIDANAWETKQIAMFKELTNLINLSINEDEKKLKKLSAQRHYEDIIADI